MGLLRLHGLSTPWILRIGCLVQLVIRAHINAVTSTILNSLVSKPRGIALLRVSVTP